MWRWRGREGREEKGREGREGKCMDQPPRIGDANGKSMQMVMPQVNEEVRRCWRRM
jgi:hypothetical protein